MPSSANTGCHRRIGASGSQPSARPDLAGLIGRPVAGDSDHDQLPVLRAARAAGEVWDRERLEPFLRNPEAIHPGIWMG